jgi:hypothetical protein
MSASADGVAWRGRSGRPAWPAIARLLRLELRHNAMLWVLPLAMSLFWIITYRKAMALPALWNVRAATVQSGAVADFVTPVAGAAAWVGSREARRRAVDLMATVARPRFTRLLAAWVATVCWAEAGYLVCLAAVYWQTSRQAHGAGPLWWPAAVAAVSIMAFAALGFSAGVVLPSRFTAPVVAIVAFFLVVLSTELIVGSQSYWQVSPIVSGAWELGADPGVATFYPFLPDLSVAQIMFLAGLTLALVAAALGLPAAAGSRPFRLTSAIAAAIGVATAGTAIGLTGTGSLNAHGMISIPVLHNAADDRPLHVTPACGRTPIPVCLNPAYSAYLPAVAGALDEALTEIAGLPGAPVRISQAAATYWQGSGNQVAVGLAGGGLRGSPPVYYFLLPDQLGGPPTLTASGVGQEIRTTTGPAIITSVIGDVRGASAAQQAVAEALMKAAGFRQEVLVTRRGAPAPQPGRAPNVVAAARRFWALPAQVRRAWLDHHLAALRAGRITLRELP